jgi:hypothetical protein
MCVRVLAHKKPYGNPCHKKHTSQIKNTISMTESEKFVPECSSVDGKFAIG